MPLAVHIKHAGKIHDVALDPDQPPSVFKDAVYNVTGVPPDRMKVMVKGGMLKDDSDWKKIAPKEGQTFMVIGAAGELPKPPEKPIVFLEDMEDSDLAQALAVPVGLKNLGNTCYANATIQSLRAIPELQDALERAPASASLANTLRSLFSSMTSTTEAVVPSAFLTTLRQINPQFAERDRSKGGPSAMLGMGMYAQQDADECWGTITSSLTALDGLPGPSGSASSGTSFIEQYLTGSLRTELKCDEAPEEPPSVSTEKVLKLECNISQTTNFMLSGIKESLDQKVEKHSPTLGRDAMYTKTSRLTRLPAYLPVHMVRFAWKREINKKAKIMRRVKFPTSFDALDLASDELKSALLPVSRKLQEVQKERAERRKVRKRTKNGASSSAPAAAAAPAAPEASSSSAAATSDGDVEMASVDTATESTETSADKGKKAEGAGEERKEGEALEPESVYRAKEVKELEALVPEEVRADVGASQAGLYELVAIITHKGAAADSGHYMGFVKKSVFHARSLSDAVNDAKADADEDEDWYKFDDDKVSVFPAAKLPTLEGGGEDSSAYVLLYKSVGFA